MFKEGNQYGKGRPKGSQNKAPNRDELINLLNRIINEFTDEFDALTNVVLNAYLDCNLLQPTAFAVCKDIVA